MAERGGFEPPIRLLAVYRFSKPAPSATRPSLQPFIISALPDNWNSQVNNLILTLDTDGMKTTKAVSKSANPGKDWQKTQFSNLIRCVPSGDYFARIRVRGKLIRKSLKTDVLTTAKLRLADFDKNERADAESNESVFRGRMTFADCVAIFKAQTEASNLLKPSAKIYRNEALASIVRSWPDIEKRDVCRFSPSDCTAWAAQFSNQYSATRYNATLGVLQNIFKIAIQAGALFRNPAQEVHRAKVRLKMLKLPDTRQFELFIREIESANGRDSRKCADLVRFWRWADFGGAQHHLAGF